MATYRIRNLYCMTCNVPRKARNQIIDDIEMPSSCFECNTPLMAKPDLGDWLESPSPMFAKVKPTPIGSFPSVSDAAARQFAKPENPVAIVTYRCGLSVTFPLDSVDQRKTLNSIPLQCPNDNCSECHA